MKPVLAFTLLMCFLCMPFFTRLHFLVYISV